MMSEGLMSGMIWGGVLLSSVPISLGIGIGIYVLRRYLADRAAQPGGVPSGVEKEVP